MKWLVLKGRSGAKQHQDNTCREGAVRREALAWVGMATNCEKLFREERGLKFSFSLLTT